MNRGKWLIVGIASILFLFCLAINFFSSTKRVKNNYLVELTDKVDPEIILINIGDEDRASIANLLLLIDSCKPVVIGIDAWFIDDKDSMQDAQLHAALKYIQNDILAYTLDSAGYPLYSNKKFRTLVSDEGLVKIVSHNDLSSDIIPIELINNEPHEIFSLKIIRHWKPMFKHSLKLNKPIPINFTRTLRQFSHFEGRELREKNVCEYVKNKVVLLGYIGPSNEDKHFTPIRNVRVYKAGEPDTYGLVIIANEIRTILEYAKQ